MVLRMETWSLMVFFKACDHCHSILYISYSLRYQMKLRLGLQIQTVLAGRLQPKQALNDFLFYIRVNRTLNKKRDNTVMDLFGCLCLPEG